MRYVANRLTPIHAGIIATFLLIPVWFRLPQLPIIAPLYVTRFLVLIPILWTITVWLITGLPGLKTFLEDRTRAAWGLSLLALGLWAFVSQDWAFMRVRHPEVGATAALQLCIVVLFALVVACAAPSPRWIVCALAIGLFWNASLALLQAVNQSSVGLLDLGEFRMTPTTPGASVVVAGGLRWLRPYGLLPHPNMLAGFLMLALLAATSLLVSRNRDIRWLGTTLLLWGLWALLLTFSRSAWLSFAAGVFILYPMLRARLRENAILRHVIISGILAVILGIGFALAYFPLLAARGGAGMESVELRSISDRTVFTNYALESIYEQPLLGVGMGNFPWRMSYYLADTGFDLRGDNVHHVFLSAWAELGLIGVLVMVAALGFGIEAALRTIKQHRTEHDYIYRAGLLAGGIAFIAVGLFDHYPWTLLQMQIVWWGSLAAALSVGAHGVRPNKTDAVI